MANTYFMRADSGYVFETTQPKYHTQDTQITKAEGKAAIKAQAVTELLTLIKPSSTIRTLVRSVSASGMSRRISSYVVDSSGDIVNIDYYISKVTGYKHSDKGGLIVGGCGMDMGFHLVYTLGAMLWPNGTDTAHSTRNGQPDSTGGYALKQRAL